MAFVEDSDSVRILDADGGRLSGYGGGGRGGAEKMFLVCKGEEE